MFNQSFKKYHNEPCYADGILFHSKREARRYMQLKLFVTAGEIKNLVLQPKFVLQPAFKDWSGKAQRPVIYIADFQYNDKKYNWNLVVEDSKGKRTQDFINKSKTLMYQNKELIFIET